MVMGNLIYTVIIIPLTLLMISSSGKGSIVKNLKNAVMQPLVFLPILGSILAISGIKLPEILENAVNELGKTSGGVALFFLGLLISGIKFKLNFEIAFNVFVKNFVQGGLILGTGWLLGLEGDLLKSAFLIGVLPTAMAVPAPAGVEEDARFSVKASTAHLSPSKKLKRKNGAF